MGGGGGGGISHEYIHIQMVPLLSNPSHAESDAISAMLDNSFYGKNYTHFLMLSKHLASQQKNTVSN